MKRRTPDEMINYVSQRVSEMMDANKTELLSMVTAISPTTKNRPTGKWINFIGKDLGIKNQWLRDDGKTVFIQCDQCASLYVRSFMVHANYCPNCGCRMEVERLLKRDYISREAALKIVYTSTAPALEIRAMPAADVVERKVGHWIFHPEQKNIYGGKLIECSKCKTQYLVMNVVEEIYCRHCGSKNQNGGQDDV